jgi:hypothetical protein
MVRAEKEKEPHYFRCSSCYHGVTIDADVGKDAILRCPQCRRVFGRADRVCADAVDATHTLASQVLIWTRWRSAMNRVAGLRRITRVETPRVSMTPCIGVANATAINHLPGTKMVAVI